MVFFVYFQIICLCFNNDLSGYSYTFIVCDFNIFRIYVSLYVVCRSRSVSQALITYIDFN